MRDLFACRKCNAIYSITRRHAQPEKPPICDACGQDFPPSELGDWLVYERIFFTDDDGAFKNG
jgi:hypothetical protein